MIKESYRLSEHRLKKGYDIVVIARVNAKDASYHDIDRALCGLLKKQDLFLNIEK